MTKKHFIALADTLRIELKGELHPEDFQMVCNCLSGFCKSQNSSFKQERWIGYINGWCGPNGGRIKGQ